MTDRAESAHSGEQSPSDFFVCRIPDRLFNLTRVDSVRSFTGPPPRRDWVARRFRPLTATGKGMQSDYIGGAVI